MNFLSIFRKLWAWVLVGLAVLYLFNMASGSIYSRKLWNMLHDQIIQEERAIQEELEIMFTTEPLSSRRSFYLLSGRETTTGQKPMLSEEQKGFFPVRQKLLICRYLPANKTTALLCALRASVVNPCLKKLIQENARIKNQLAAAQEEKRVLLGRLHEIETQLNAVASNLPSSLLMGSVAVCECVYGVVPRLRVLLV